MNAINLLKRLLNKNPKKRPDTKEILESSWFIKKLKNSKKEKIDPDILRSLREYNQPKQLARKILKFLVKNLKEDQIEKLKQTFKMIDKKNTGFIDLSELEKAFHDCSIEIPHEEINNILINCGIDNKICYSNFVTATYPKKELLNKENLLRLFNYLDIDKSGQISAHDFQKALNRTGKSNNIKEIEEMFHEVGYNENTEINFDNFCNLLENEL